MKIRVYRNNLNINLFVIFRGHVYLIVIMLNSYRHRLFSHIEFTMERVLKTPYVKLFCVWDFLDAYTCSDEMTTSNNNEVHIYAHPHMCKHIKGKLLRRYVHF